MNMLGLSTKSKKKDEGAAEGGDEGAADGDQPQAKSSTSGNKDSDKGSDVEQMKRGDYMIHVYVE